MSKIIFISFLLINICLSQIGEVIPEKQLRSLKPKKAEPAPKVEDKKQEFKLFQTLYSDSFSNNYYYATLYIGPKQIKQTYIIDTGTATMSSPCAPCDECGKHKTNYYEELEKKANKPLKCSSKICKMVPASECNVKEKYKDKKTCSFYNQKPNGDGLRGYYLSNIVYFEEGQNQTTTDKKKVYRSYALPLGCTVGEYGKYKEIKSDGVMGLNNEETSFISLLYKLKIINKNIFSICFGHSGGYMSLGEIDPIYHTERGIKYIPLLDDSNLYKIKIKDITISNSTINYNGDAVIDSTTTLTYFPENLYKEINNKFNTYCEKNNCGKFENIENKGYCSSFEDRETLFNTLYKIWPEIIFIFDINNKDINNTIINFIWKSFNYYLLYSSEEPKKACLSFVPHKLNYIILGTKFFQGYDIIFNREEKKLGFIKADCSRGNLLWRRGKYNFNKFYNGNEMENRDKNGIIRKFIVKFNNTDDGIDFIRGRNSELNFSSDFKFINFILLLFSIIIVVVVAIVVISFLICNKKTGLRYEEPDVAIESEPEKNDDNYNENYD